MEDIGKELLEVIAVQARISPLEQKLAKLSEKLSIAQETVDMAKNAKSEANRQKEEADIEVTVAEQKLREAQHAVKKAQDVVGQCKVSVGEAGKIADKYSEEYFNELCQVIRTREDDRDSIRAELDETSKELNDVKSDIAQRQESLKEKGYELNIGIPIVRPKTTYL